MTEKQIETLVINTLQQIKATLGSGDTAAAQGLIHELETKLGSSCPKIEINSVTTQGRLELGVVED